MSNSFKIPNFKAINIKEVAKLDQDLPAGNSSLTLVNNNNITADDYILLGGRGSELGEIKVVQNATGATLITTAATSLPHVVNSEVFALIGSQLKVYRANNVNSLAPADDAFTFLGTPVDIDPDQLSTDFTDLDGSAAHWYKFTYFNPITTAETSLADSVAVRGGGVGQYVSIDAIRQEAGFGNNRNIGEDLIDEKRQAAQQLINGMLAGRYLTPFVAPVNPLIARIAMLLAAGYLQLSQWGSYSVSDTNNGQKKVDEAMGLLQQIKSGQLVLTNPDGSSAEIPDDTSGGSNDLGFSGYPNGDTENSPGGSGFMFPRNAIDGYESRQY